VCFYSTAFHKRMHWSKGAPALTGNDVEGELRVKIGACYAPAELGVLQCDRF
jgi:hypothetical protein